MNPSHFRSHHPCLCHRFPKTDHPYFLSFYQLFLPVVQHLSALWTTSLASPSSCYASHGWEPSSCYVTERIGLSGPVLGLVRICGRGKGEKNRDVIIGNSFLDTYKINLGISIEPVYHPDLKKIFLLLVNLFLKFCFRAIFFDKMSFVENAVVCFSVSSMASL